MIFRILSSLVLAVVAIFALHALVEFRDPNTQPFAWIVIVGICGYHRVIVPKDGNPAFKIDIPDRQHVQVRLHMWGLPLGKARRLVVPAKVLQFAKDHPVRERVKQALPNIARWMSPRNP